MILHSSSENVLAYETKLYESITNQPFWKESLTKDIVRGSYKNIVVVFDKKELNFNICHIIQLMGIILYKIDGRDKILPIDDITQRHMDLMNKKFDILPSSHLGMLTKFTYILLTDWQPFIGSSRFYDLLQSSI